MIRLLPLLGITVRLARRTAPPQLRALADRMPKPSAQPSNIRSVRQPISARRLPPARAISYFHRRPHILAPYSIRDEAQREALLKRISSGRQIWLEVIHLPPEDLTEEAPFLEKLLSTIQLKRKIARIQWIQKPILGDDCFSRKYGEKLSPETLKALAEELARDSRRFDIQIHLSTG